MQLIENSLYSPTPPRCASCASSGAPTRSSKGKSGIGSTSGMGICHSFTDGRCVALLKILLTNFCLYDCQYCVNRRPATCRARFTPEEVVTLTIDFLQAQLHQRAVSQLGHHSLRRLHHGAADSRG